MPSSDAPAMLKINKQLKIFFFYNCTFSTHDTYNYMFGLSYLEYITVLKGVGN